MKISKIALLVAFLYATGACTKNSVSGSSTRCVNPDALNYNQSGPCNFAKYNILVHPTFKVKLTKYTLDPSQVGDSFAITASSDVCYDFLYDSVYRVISLSWPNSFLYPYDYCVLLTGYNFTLTDSTPQLTWAGAWLTGTGSFANGGFLFSGNIHSSYGDSAIVIQSY